MFSHKRGYVSFEKPGTQSGDDDRDGKHGGRILAMLDNSRDGRDDEDDVADEGDSNGDTNCVESPEIRVCNPSSEEGRYVAPSSSEN